MVGHYLPTSVVSCVCSFSVHVVHQTHNSGIMHGECQASGLPLVIIIIHVYTLKNCSSARTVLIINYYPNALLLE